MRKLIILLGILLGTTVLADQTGTTTGSNSPVTQQKCGDVKVECKPRTIYQTWKQQKRIKDLEAEVARLKAELKKYEWDAIEEEEYDYPENAISLFGGPTPTGLKTTKTGGSIKVETDYEPDLGLMFQHDFDEIRGSIAVTLQGTAFLGLGVVF